jgi:tetratricopeptide (TPR) repeat protein/GT2 family glycosyltransferase
MRFFSKFPGHLSLARALAREGDKARDRGAYAIAAKTYARALKLDPTRTDIYVQYGHMSKELGRHREAEVAYRRALSRSPGDGEIHLQLGHLLKLTGKMKEAFEAYKEAQVLLPANTAATAELHNLGSDLLSNAPDPPSTEVECQAHVQEGDCLRDARRYAEAAEAYGAALAAAPFRTDIRVQYANMLKDAGRFAEAESNYRLAASEKPDDADIHLQLGHVLKLQSKRTAALEAYGRAAELAPFWLAPQEELVNLGEHTYRALAAGSFRSDIRVRYANMLKDTGRFAEAESNYRLAASEKPDDADIHLQLGHVLKLQGKSTAALEAYGWAAKLAPLWLAPQEELFKLGERSNQEALFEAQLRLGGVDALTILTQNILELRESLDRLAQALPNIQSQMAFPVGCYDTFRSRYDVPPPPRPTTVSSFGVFLLADREPLETLYAQLEAVRSQAFERWRLYVIGADIARKRIVERATAGNVRIQWMQALPDESLAEAERRIALSVGVDWIVLLSERGLLHPRALEWFGSVAGHTEAVAFITDEETRIDNSGFARLSSPEFRQTVDYHTLLEMNTCGETVAVELKSYRLIAHLLVVTSVSASRSSLLLALSRDGRVGHIPCPLVCRDGETVTDPAEAVAAHEEAVRAHILRESLGERVQIGPRSGPSPRLPIVWHARDPGKSIALIVPTRDNGPDVAQLVESLRATASAPDGFRVVIVDNGSRQEETRHILAELEMKEGARVLRLDEPFNWSRLNNRAVETLDSPVLVFANDDMRMLSEKWDEHVRGLLERPEIGAVGARLLYKDDTVQHAGVLFGWGGSVIHDGLSANSTDPGPASRWQVSRAVGAVTGAFLATRREVFLGHQGFDEIHLAVSYSDIDYALKLRASSLKVLWTPDITLYHHESKTRGLDHLDSEKGARDAAERAVMAARWGTAMVIDPSVNPIWHMATLPFRLLSAPSQSRLWAYIERSAETNPWLLEPNKSRSVSPRQVTTND